MGLAEEQAEGLIFFIFLGAYSQLCCLLSLVVVLEATALGLAPFSTLLGLGSRWQCLAGFCFLLWGFIEMLYLVHRASGWGLPAISNYSPELVLCKPNNMPAWSANYTYRS